MSYQYFFGSKFANGANLVNATSDQMHQATVAAVNSGGIGPESEMVEFLSAMRSKCLILIFLFIRQGFFYYTDIIEFDKGNKIL